MPTLEVQITVAPVVNFALEQCDVPVVSDVRIINTGDTRLEGLTLRVMLEPALAGPVLVPLAVLSGGETVELGPVDVRLPPGRLRQVVEAERARLEWQVEDASGAVLAARGHDVRVLAHNEWPGHQAPPSLLAMFALSNHGALTPLVQQVREFLARGTGDGALSGYQERSPERVRAMVQALHEAVQALGLSYAGVPPSFETAGQKVRLPDILLSQRMGNCLDISLLMASVLEHLGLRPLLILVQGHAFLAVWLIEESFPEGVVHDAARLRTILRLGQLLALNPTTTVAANAPSFAEAEAAALTYLQDDARFICAVDVHVARADGYRPLSLRDTAAPAPSVAEPVLMSAPPLPAGTGPTSTLAAPGPSAPPPIVVARFKRWKDKLLDLSLRNKLLNFRVDSKGILPLLVPELGHFEDLLSGLRPFELRALPAVDPRDQRDATLAAAREDRAEIEARRRADLERRIIQVDLPEAEMMRRAVALDRDAREDQAEGGANTLFVGLGVLKWFETGSSLQPRFAPLLFLPVRLEYDRTRRRIAVTRTEDDPIANVTLVEKMRADFAVDLSAAANLESDDAGVDVPRLLAGAREAIKAMPRWEVLDEALIGVFTFTRFLMWKDLEDNASILLMNPVVRHIAEGAKRAFPETVGAPDARTLDDQPQPPLVVDADSTQTCAVVAALKGRSFVLQGPPGTGKSQTITNVIAATIASGKTVLFVSEKMAALEVVQRRLTEAGLGDHCLELHSNKANKRQVIESLGKVFERETVPADPAWEAENAALDELRGRLNAYTRALHAPRPAGFTFFTAQGWLLGLQAAPDVRIPWPDAAKLTSETLGKVTEAVAQLATAARAVEPLGAHPWREADVTRWSAGEEESLHDLIAAAAASARQVAESAAEVATLVRAPRPETTAEREALVGLAAALSAGPCPQAALHPGWGRVSAEAVAWLRDQASDDARRASLATRWDDALFALDIAQLAERFRRWAGAFFLLAYVFLFMSRRSLATTARGRLGTNRGVLVDLEAAEAIRTTATDLEARRARLAVAMEGLWSGEREARDELSALVARGDGLAAALTQLPALPDGVQALMGADVQAGQRHALAAAGQRLAARQPTWEAHARELTARLSLKPAVTESLASFRSRLATWQQAEARGRYRDLCLYGRACVSVEQLGLATLVEAHRSGQVSAAALEPAARRAILSRWVSAVRDQEPALRDFDGAEQNRLVSRFRKLDHHRISQARRHVVSRLDARKPQADGSFSETSEPGILSRELKKKNRHLPIRRLLQQVPNLLVRLKPCLLMSPLSVAQYLPAGGRRFDLVVFDEASQIGTHDAIGAIARGEQVVIVGDSRQLPPTSFFSRDADDQESLPDENDILEVESILDEALAARMPEQMLGWHYRSRHESLIDFSNRHYYDAKLNIFPSARGRVRDLGLQFCRVDDGVYEKGQSRANPREAERLVDWLIDELRKTPAGTRTFGVVTFSMAQQTVVQDLLDQARSRFPEIEPHFADSLQESVFVKNLENVQGDERDVILFSVCYGPDSSGRTAMNFGPLNRRGGQRRLNVAITRARQLLRVYSTIVPEQIDLSRTNAIGARHLRAFLQYAQEQSASESRPHARDDFDSDFERQVFDELAALGYRVHCQVGCGGYRIDMAVEDPNEPGVYVLGVECDGRAYHSGATACDRDRLRQQVLEGLGWRLHRIWSTDWWFHRAAEIERLNDAVQAAIRVAHAQRTAPPVLVVAPPAPAPVTEVVRIATSAPPRLATPAIRGRTDPPMVVASPYERAELGFVVQDPEVMYLSESRGRIRERLSEIVRVESPIHADEACRRVAACWGAARLTDRVKRHLGETIGSLGAFGGQIVARGDFLWRRSHTPSVEMEFRGADITGTWRAPEHIADEELAAGAAWALARSLSMDEAELVRETARVFGIGRLGRKVEDRMAAGVAVLVRSGKARREGERLVWVG